LEKWEICFVAFIIPKKQKKKTDSLRRKTKTTEEKSFPQWRYTPLPTPKRQKRQKIKKASYIVLKTRDRHARRKAFSSSIVLVLFISFAFLSCAAGTLECCSPAL